MEKMKFGLSQVKKQTPTFIRNLKRAINFAAGSIVTFIPSIAEWMECEIKDLTTIIGIVLVVVNSVGIMFGIQPQEENGNVDNTDGGEPNP